VVAWWAVVVGVLSGLSGLSGFGGWLGYFGFSEARDLGSNPESITKGLILSFSIYSTYHSTLKYYLKYLKKERSQEEYGLETF
jgi:hypothetical protein